MKCWNCNEELEDDSLYCTSCGKMQNVSQEKQSEPSGNNEDKGKKCPYCGKILDENTNYCIFCGKKLSVPVNPKQSMYKYLCGIAVLVLVFLVWFFIDFVASILGSLYPSGLQRLRVRFVSTLYIYMSASVEIA